MHIGITNETPGIKIGIVKVYWEIGWKIRYTGKLVGKFNLEYGKRTGGYKAIEEHGWGFYNLGFVICLGN